MYNEEVTLVMRSLNQKPILYYPVYKDLTGSVEGGILLSQLLFWFSSHKDKIYKTDSEFQQETNLSEYELRKAKKDIKKLTFIRVSREGVPAKTYYEINWERYFEAIKNVTKSTDCRISTNKSNAYRRTRPSNIDKLYTKNTTKNTTKNFSDKSENDGSGDPDKYSPEKRKLPKIIIPAKKKDPDPTPVNKGKYSHTVKDFRRYGDLVNAGCTSHRDTSKAYLRTLDNIHVLFNMKRCKKHPLVSFIEKEFPNYIDREWTIDDVISTFAFYVKQMKEQGKGHIKSAGDFIFFFGREGVKAWSPFIYWFYKKETGYGVQPSSQAERLLNAFENIGVRYLGDLDTVILNRIAEQIHGYEKTYSLLDSSMNHLYPAGLYSILAEYVKKQQNNVDFQWYWCKKADFIDSFIKEKVRSNLIAKKKRTPEEIKEAIRKKQEAMNNI